MPDPASDSSLSSAAVAVDELVEPSREDALESAITAALAGIEAHLPRAGSEAAPLIEGARRATRGGKRLRARLCLAATDACGGRPDLKVAAALELFQAAALVHDDLMDAADTRRGEPSAHRWFEAQGLPARSSGDADAAVTGASASASTLAQPTRLGEGGAILLGDLLLAWSATTFAAATATLPLERRLALTQLFGAMSAEVALGQYLDLLATLAPWGDQDALDRAWRVIESKTARYSVELPLVIGARLAGADDVVVDWLARLGHEVGVAFQLRDDVLGVMGEPEVTGKPSGDDIREGKRTVLLELAYRDADEQGRETLQSLVGSPGLSSEQLARVRSVLTRSGALDQVEQLIAAHAARARALLAAPPPGVQGTAALGDLVSAALDREA